MFFILYSGYGTLIVNSLFLLSAFFCKQYARMSLMDYHNTAI